MYAPCIFYPSVCTYIAVLFLSVVGITVLVCVIPNPLLLPFSLCSAILHPVAALIKCISPTFILAICSFINILHLDSYIKWHMCDHHSVEF